MAEENCDLESKKSLEKVLAALEELFREHYILFQLESNIQRDILDKLWAISQRFLILKRGVPCARPYPPEISNLEEREIRAKFKTEKNLLHKSRTKLTSSLCNIKDHCAGFDRLFQKIDASLPNHIIEGDANRKPIYYYIELFASIFKFYRELQNKLNLLGGDFLIEDIGSILEYKSLIEPDKDINDYFESCLKIDNKSYVSLCS